MRKFTINILLFAFMVLILYGCTGKEEVKEKGPEVIPVKVEKAELKDLSSILEYVGNIKAQDEVQVYPKVTGKIIEKIKEDGAAVAKGETIAYIDRDEVGFKFEKAPVDSPIAGIVGRVYVDIGSNVNPQVPVALVVNMDRVKIDLDLPEKYLPKITTGQLATVSVDAYPEEEFMGTVTKVSPVVDLATRTAPIEITLENTAHRLKSGMFARVALVIEQHKNAVVIMKEAILGKEPDTYTYIIKNKKAVLKKITLGLRQGQYYEVTDGLKEADLVVIMGQQRLRHGADVIAEGQNNK